MQSVGVLPWWRDAPSQRRGQTDVLSLQHVEIMKKSIVIMLLATLLGVACTPTTLSSPDGRIGLSFNLSDNGEASYSVSYDSSKNAPANAPHDIPINCAINVTELFA